MTKSEWQAACVRSIHRLDSVARELAPARRQIVAVSSGSPDSGIAATDFDSELSLLLQSFGFEVHEVPPADILSGLPGIAAVTGLL